MLEITLKVESATLESVAPYGRLVAAHEGSSKFLTWPGVDVYGATPITIGEGGELLLVKMAAQLFPVQVGMIERHFKHTQTYLPFNGKAFIMVLGIEAIDNMPDFTRLRAFLFENGSGIVLHTCIWHEFPHAINDDTQFAAILRSEAHINTLDEPLYAGDAVGPDLQRYAVHPRAKIFVSF